MKQQQKSFILIHEQMAIRSLGYVDEIFVRKQLDVIFPLQDFANSVSDYAAVQSITTQTFIFNFEQH